MIGLLALAAALASIPAPHAESPNPDQLRRIEPIGGYTLALIWTPEHCVRTVPGAEGFVCGPETGRGFVLHGLWPDGVGKSWPQWCADAAILPPRAIRKYYHATPSAQLMQHEWAKHGTCMRVTSDGYFRRSSRLFATVHSPDMFALGLAPLTVGAFAQAFATVNPGMRPDMVNVNLDRDGWLREVWLCLDTKFRRRRCAVPMPTDRTVRIRLPD